MPRYKIQIEYKGTNFSGWQMQANSISVQEVIEKAISKFTNIRTVIFGSGRTDAGVHALGQIAHFDLEKEYEPYKILRSINHCVKPHEIIIHNCEVVDSSFHARFSAKKRSYIYKIINQDYPSIIHSDLVWHIKSPLKIEWMQEAAKVLIGKHDFSSFRSSQCQAKSAIRSINDISISQRDNLIEILISAPSFMHNQVRIITGCLVKVGKGEWDANKIKAILSAKDRSLAAPTAPPHG